MSIATHSSTGFQKDSVLRIVSSVIIVLALASPARLARAGDQGNGTFVDWNPRVSCEGQ
jgi:hypothetical protein